MHAIDQDADHDAAAMLMRRVKVYPTRSEWIGYVLVSVAVIGLLWLATH